jgi:hypothetical protein
MGVRNGSFWVGLAVHFVALQADGEAIRRMGLRARREPLSQTDGLRDGDHLPESRPSEGLR